MSVCVPGDFFSFAHFEKWGGKDKIHKSTSAQGCFFDYCWKYQMSKRTISEAFGVPKINPVRKTQAEVLYFAKYAEQARKRRALRENVMSKWSELKALYVCPNPACQSTTAVEFVTVQRRGADEGMINECTCTACGEQFRRSK